MPFDSCSASSILRYQLAGTELTTFRANHDHRSPMALEMQLWRVGEERLEAVPLSRLNDERRLEDWIDQAPSILGMDILPIGRQVATQFSGRIDVLALDRDANCVVVELKRDRTPEELMGRAWFKDREQIAERGQSGKAAPWSGYWFVNVGEGEHRNWDDNREYGFITAGQHPRYSGPLTNLRVGDKIFAYLKGQGYAGYGEVTQEAMPITDFVIQPSGTPLMKCSLTAPNFRDNIEDPQLSEWIVGVRWLKALPREQAKSFKGIFANQNVVRKLRHSETLNYLFSAFRVE